MSSQITLETSWKSRLSEEFSKSYMKELKQFLLEEKKRKKRIYPQGNHCFKALDLTAFANVKVVILGQDPYHGSGQAHGLCFSVPLGIGIPPSLLNIYKELKRDLGIPMGSHGCLEAWTQEGVLLLNNTLTVEAGRAGSHRGKGWEQFTDKIISLINEEKEGVVFLLWGKAAQEKGALIHKDKHLVLTSSHPSPFSADRGFLGCSHFSQANKYLESQGKTPVNWAAHLKTHSKDLV